MSFEFSLEKPTWSLSLGLDFSLTGPFKDAKDAIKNVMQVATNEVLDANQVVQETFNRADELYLGYKQAKTQITAAAEGAIATLANDLSEAGLKMIVMKPFQGGMSDLRAEVGSALSFGTDNVPAFSPGAYTASILIVVSIGQELASVSEMLINLTKAMMTVFGADNDDENSKGFNDQMNRIVTEMQENPATTFFSDALTEDPKWLSTAKDEISNTTDKNWDMVGMGKEVLDDVKTNFNNSGLGNVTKDFTNPYRKNGGPASDFLRNYQQIIRSPVSSAPVMSGDIEPNSVYKIKTSLPDETCIIEYPPKSGLKYGISSNPDDLINSSTFTGFFGQPNFEIISGTPKITKIANNSPIGEGTKMRSFYRDGQQFLSDPFDKWYSVFSLGDILGGPIKNAASLANNMLQTVGDSLDGAADTVMNSAAWVSQIVYSTAERVTDVTNGANAILDAVPNEIELLGFDILTIPPGLGGLDQLRFANQQWLDEGVEGAPSYNEGVVMMPILIAGGLPSPEPLQAAFGIISSVIKSKSTS